MAYWPSSTRRHMAWTAFCLESTNSVRRCWPSLSLSLTFNIKQNVALEQNLISGRRFCWFRILWTSKWVSLAQTKNILPLRQKVQKPNWYFHLIMFKVKSVKIFSIVLQNVLIFGKLYLSLNTTQPHQRINISKGTTGLIYFYISHILHFLYVLHKLHILHILHFLHILL